MNEETLNISPEYKAKKHSWRVYLIVEIKAKFPPQIVTSIQMCTHILKFSLTPNPTVICQNFQIIFTVIITGPGGWPGRAQTDTDCRNSAPWNRSYSRVIKWLFSGKLAETTLPGICNDQG